MAARDAVKRVPEITRNHCPTSAKCAAWSLAYHHHPGFENNEGGHGTLTWDITGDSITLDHADRYVECSHSYDEGL